MLKSRMCFPAMVLFAAFSLIRPAAAWEMTGTRNIFLDGRDGRATPIGTVTFTPEVGRIGIALDLDYTRFQDFFLSMKEFKCIETPDEVVCHVPYPHANPQSVTPDDLAWLEHALLFFYKAPSDFGAKLWNGVYYKLRLTERGLVGTPQAIDLNQIGAPPDDTATPPYGPGERSEIAPGARWFGTLRIE
ncbi:hypothetical protein O4G98_07010 [Zoogloeaceae bacterium G21618-S1]|nr:hypothetical protein [Zoogloeaceae bacterium G21618-S1]